MIENITPTTSQQLLNDPTLPAKPMGSHDRDAFAQAIETKANAPIQPVNSIFEIQSTGQKTAWKTYDGYIEELNNHRQKQLEMQQRYIEKMLNEYPNPDSQLALERMINNIDNQIASIRATAEGVYTTPLKSTDINPNSLIKPASSFINFLTKGENQLLSLEKEIARVFDSGNKTVNPADLLKFQLRMSHITQQLELFTSTLNKGLDSFKNVSNTQL